MYVLLTVYSGGGGGGYILVGLTASHNCQLCELFRGNIGNNEEKVQTATTISRSFIDERKNFRN